MGLVLGTNVVLSFLKDESYQPFICSTECSLEIELDLKDVRGPKSGKWKKKRGQSLGYRVSLSGLIELVSGSPRTFWLVDNQLMMLSMPFRMVFEDPESGLLKIASGTAIIRVSQLTSSSTSFANSSFDFEGDGELVMADSATTCNATIGAIEIGAGDPDMGSSATVSYTGVTNAARLEYSVDGGAREVIFDPGSSGFFHLFGLADGPHTLEVWAVCEFGVDGESNSFEFEVVGGEPVACAIPGTPVMSLITTTTATATWAAASPAPADGYEWELVNQNTSTVVDTGTTAGLSENLTGLSEGVPYLLRVRSICETGVSTSSFVSVEFNAASSCNVPGSPVMSLITETTATATWTAPSPAPADGYEWEVKQFLSVIDSGTTDSLSVNLTGLPSGTLLTFQVKSICGVGSESGFNSTGFTTGGEENNIEWNWIEDEGNGTLVIRVNGVDVVFETTAGTGSFTTNAGDEIQVLLTATTGHIVVDDTTASLEIENESASGITIALFTTTSGHNYSIFAEVTS